MNPENYAASNPLSLLIIQPLLCPTQEVFGAKDIAQSTIHWRKGLLIHIYLLLCVFLFLCLFTFLFVYFYFCFREILRIIDSLQLTAQKKVATPVDWQVKNKLIHFPLEFLFILM